MTELLATRCDRLLSSDIIPAALQRAEARLRRKSHVWLEERSIPEQWPSGPFDLVVLSEIAYYFDVSDLGRIMTCVMGSTVRGAHVVGVHWRGETNYPLTGDRVTRSSPRRRVWSSVVHHREEEFVLGRLGAAVSLRDARRAVAAVGVVLPVHDEERLLPGSLQALEVAVNALPPSISCRGGRRARPML